MLSNRGKRQHFNSTGVGCLHYTMINFAEIHNIYISVVDLGFEKGDLN